MVDRTDLVIAVDDSQVKSATETLRTLGFQATIAETASSRLTKASSEMGRTLATSTKAGAAGAKELSTSIGKAASDLERIGSTASKKSFVIEVDQSRVQLAIDALDAMGYKAQAVQRSLVELGHTEVALPITRAAQTQVTSTQTNTVKTNIDDEAREISLEVGRAQVALINLADATTSLGATAPIEKLNSSLKDTNVAALEAARAMIQAQEANERLHQMSGGLTLQDAVPGIRSQRPNGPSDQTQINSFVTSAERAERAAEKLGQTISRSIGGGADAAEKSLNDLSQATTSLGATAYVDIDKLTTSLGAASAKAQETTTEVNRLKASLGSLDNVGTSLGATVGPAVQSGDIRSRFAAVSEADNQAILSRLTAGATKEIDAQANAVKKNTAAHDGHWKSVRRVAYEQQQLAYQLHDFTIQVLGGQSPFLALVQQGSQLAGVFGGIGGAFRAVTALITPTVVAVGALAVSVGGLALALAQVESSTRGLNTLKTQFEATGRASEVSDESLKKLIQTLQLTPGVSKSAAVSIVSEFSKAHEVTAELGNRVSLLVADFARATGQDIPAAAKALAGAFSDPARGAKALEDALGSLRSGEILAIEGFVNVGDKARAQEVLFEALKRSVEGLADKNRTDLERSINSLGNAWDALMRSFEASDGLKTVLNYLSKIVDAIAWLINNIPKIPNIDVGLLALPNGIPAAAGAAVGRAARRGIASFFGGESETPTRTNPTASGKVTGADGKPTTASAAVAGTKTDFDDDIKASLKLVESYRSLGSQIDVLTKKRDKVSEDAKKAAQQYGFESEQAKRLREGVVGMTEAITQLQKRQQAGNSQGEQVLDLVLKNRINAIKDGLSIFRDSIQTEESLLNTAYQLGESSLKETFDRRVELIREGSDAQIKAIDEQIAAIQDRMSDPKLDPVRRERFGEQTDDLRRERALIQARTENDVTQVNDRRRVSFEQLIDQTEAYRAELLRLKGDEAGAAEALSQATIRRAQILAGQANGTPGLARIDVNELRRAVEQQNALNRAREVTSNLNERLAIQESGIARLVENGSISQLTGFQQIGAARQKTVDELEKIVEAMEEVAALTQNRDNWRLQLDTAQAREQLEQLKDAVDPLKRTFEDAFRQGSNNALEDVLNFTKTGREALDDFARHIWATMNRVIADEITQTLFGKDGIFGNVGGIFAKVFNDNKGTKVDPATSAISGLKTAIDPTASSMTRLSASADAAANALNRIGGTPSNEQINPVRAPAGTTGSTSSDPIGDLIDRKGIGSDPIGDLIERRGLLPSGEQSVMDQFTKAAESSTAAADVLSDASITAATDVANLARAAMNGGDALTLLPSIISTIRAMATASASSSTSSSGANMLGGLLTSAIGSFSGGGFSNGTAATIANVAPGNSLDNFLNIKRGFGTYHTGGVVGSARSTKFVDPSVFVGADKYHGGGVVGLRNDEVPAILLRNEEVLTASDPRHRANLTKAMTGRGYSEEGDTTNQSNQWTKGGDSHYHITVQPPAGASRESALQWGAAAGRQMDHAMRRNGK